MDVVLDDELPGFAGLKDGVHYHTLKDQRRVGPDPVNPEGQPAVDEPVVVSQKRVEKTTRVGIAHIVQITPGYRRRVGDGNQYVRRTRWVVVHGARYVGCVRIAGYEAFLDREWSHQRDIAQLVYILRQQNSRRTFLYWQKEFMLAILCRLYNHC